jgi:hydrogenase nickel incorporation protein HypB
MKPSAAREAQPGTQIADTLRKTFDAAGVTAVAFVGPVDSGKTSIVEALLLRLAPAVRAAVVMGDPLAEKKIARIRRHGYQGVAVVTHDLTPHQLREAAGHLDLDQLDIVFIEAPGRGPEAQDVDLGAHLRIGVFAADTSGDKAAGYSLVIAGADLIVLTKVDLMQIVHFDQGGFFKAVNRINPGLDVIRTSVVRNEGIDTLSKWLEFHAIFRRRNSSTPKLFHPFAGEAGEGS